MTFTAGEGPARRRLRGGLRRSHPRHHLAVVKDVADLLKTRVSYVAEDGLDAGKEREGS